MSTQTDSINPNGVETEWLHANKATVATNRNSRG